MKNHGAKDALRLKARRRYANRLDDLGQHEQIERQKTIEAFYRRQRQGARAALSMGKKMTEPVFKEFVPFHWNTAEGTDMANEYVGKTREELAYGNRTDFELANAVFLVDRNDLALIGLQTAAKERIRWLSAQLAFAFSKPVASGVEMTVKEELLFITIQDAYLRGLDWGRKYGSTEDEELKASYDYADKTTSALLPKATAPVVSEPVPTAGKNYHDIDDPRLTGLAELMVDAASPQPQPKAVTEEMVERAYEAFVAACEWSDWDEPEVRCYVRAALEAAMKEA